jgi:WD40-like Beta Propeller Repeat
MNAKRALNRVRVPDEQGAEERTWNVVRSAYQYGAPRARRQTFRRPVGVAAAVAVVASAVALSPAGATVGRMVDRAFGVPHAARALVSLPAPGRLLVSGSDGTWIVAANGFARRVGPWREASWSPHGRYLAVTARNELAAVNTHGALQWSLVRRDVSDARWYSPTGYNVAYLSGNELRVVAGNGTGDLLLARPVAHIAPAWRPDHPHELAYITANGELMIRDSATGAKLWSANTHTRIRQLAWSADGERLLALSAMGADVYAADGHLVAKRATNDGPMTGGAISPDGRQFAIVTAGGSGAVTVYGHKAGRAFAHRVLTGVKLGQVAWSPNGQWLLISWPAADQWVFVHVSGQPHIAAVSRISQQFSRTLIPSTHVPRLEGWCCVAEGTTR